MKSVCSNKICFSNYTCLLSNRVIDCAFGKEPSLFSILYVAMWIFIRCDRSDPHPPPLLLSLSLCLCLCLDMKYYVWAGVKLRPFDVKVWVVVKFFFVFTDFTCCGIAVLVVQLVKTRLLPFILNRQHSRGSCAFPSIRCWWSNRQSEDCTLGSHAAKAQWVCWRAVWMWSAVSQSTVSYSALYRPSLHTRHQPNGRPGLPLPGGGQGGDDLWHTAVTWEPRRLSHLVRSWRRSDRDP